MRIARDVRETGGFAPSALTIGNFDGVHYGHQKLIHEVITAARERGLSPTALTFDPHPACVVAPERAPRLLTTLAERCRLLQELGVEQVLILSFTREIARLSPEEFVRQIVAGALTAKLVLVGENFRFGHKQAGNTEILEELGRSYGYETRIVAAVKWRNRVVSSSNVRRLIEDGNVALACRCLSRPYMIDGEVVAGHGIGSKQTVPTLNLRTTAEILPRPGVYITRTRTGKRWDSITNVGHRPTFGGDPELSIETFLLDPLVGAAPTHIGVEFLSRIRDERKFESPEALKAQIMLDVHRAQAFHRRSKRWVAAESV
jgi:riboflavin kinase/FMN adenylyltransferase